MMDKKTLKIIGLVAVAALVFWIVWEVATFGKKKVSEIASDISSSYKEGESERKKEREKKKKNEQFRKYDNREERAKKQTATAKHALEQLPNFTDSRDNKVYRKVTIGGQTWMAENLNYVANNSVCYENNADNCAIYGRLYNWETAKNACPAGWHLPSDAEWKTLTDFVGGKGIAGTKLKSSTGWIEKKGKVTNDYLFSALPGGFGDSKDGFGFAGYFGFWWSATEKDASYAWCWNMFYSTDNVGRDKKDETLQFSVRCVQD
jgi:uncharacterized protein (TIGR02145 family)